MAAACGTMAFAGEVSIMEHEIYVSTTGSDEGSGAFDNPLRTLSGAKEKAKEYDGLVTVYFRGGSYTFDETVNFTQDDKKNVTYKAYEGEKVTFTAGVPYTGFEETTVNGVKAFKKDVGVSSNFNVLFNETTTLLRTRYPESGYIYAKETDVKYCVNPDSIESCHRSFTAIEVNGDDIPSFKNPGDAVVRVLHYWKDEMLPVKSYDKQAGLIEFTKGSSMEFRENDRLFIENIFEALDSPGEWYLDKSEGVLYYIPYEGEEAAALTLWGSETETLITLSGVDGISFENIIFRGNGFNIKPERDISQAAYDAPTCLDFRNCDSLEITNCEFHDIAACCVFLGENVTNSAVTNCVFDNIGAQAVYIKGENVPVDSENVTKNIKIVNNKISSYGRVYFNAVGVLVINANTVEVCNNEISDGYYTAISVGWVWGYGYTVCYNNKICDNLIYNIGQGWLSDMGGIYTLGNQPGTVLSGNVIHNVAADPEEGGYGGWGIYLDEGSSYITVEKNLVYSCGSDAYHLHYGSYNTVRNNIFALSGESLVRVVSNILRVTPEDGGKLTATFTNNIYLTDNRVKTYSYWNDEAIEESDNIFWDISNGKEVYVGVYSNINHGMGIFNSMRKGYITSGKVFDPGFKNPKEFDFTVEDDTALKEAGFEMWDYSQAGTMASTTIGLDTNGGETPYNASSKSVPMTPTDDNYHWFLEIISRIVLFFQRIFSLLTK